MFHQALFVLLLLPSAASAKEWSVEVFTGSTAGVSFDDLHRLDASRIVNCDLLVECETMLAPVVQPATVKVPAKAETIVIVRGDVRTEQAVVRTQRCASIVQGRLSLRYFSPVTREYYADAGACERAVAPK